MPAFVVILMLLGLLIGANMAVASNVNANAVASQYKFQAMSLPMPPGYHPTQTIRQVNPAYQHLVSWISSVGASIAMTDVTGHGRDDGICTVDPRTNDVIVTYAPNAPAQDQFTPFVLNPSPLPYDNTMAPMGCVPGDYNGDGRMSFLVYYWGRTPIIFLAKSTATTPSPSAYKPVELMPEDVNGTYDGPDWNTNDVTVADFEGNGHPDLFVGNYFPDSAVLDPNGIDNVQMPSSLSDAQNGGGDYIFRWTGGTGGANPTVSYQLVKDAIPYADATGWTLGGATADLTGDGLPDLYIANDFGPGHLLYNESTPGHIKFITATGERGALTPKSFVLGRGSFKGMGADFSDLADNGKYDLMVSNITTPWGLQESNFVFMNEAPSDKAMASDLARSVAPFNQEAENMGMAWTGWSWDVKAGDFLNSGSDDEVQTDGFIKGTIDRWNWLQEMAMTNDDLLSNPANWPLVEPGDDIAGSQCPAFYADGGGDQFVNISQQLGMCTKADQTPTRGVATADVLGNGVLDFAIARQWGPPVFYLNESPNLGHSLGLNLYRPAADGGTAGQGLSGIGAPAYGTTVTVDYAGKTQISQLDGGSGSAGKRSFEVSFGLGSYSGPVTVHLAWVNNAGQQEHETLSLTPGTHNLMLTSTATEVASS
ncbi:MAG TPA: ASPIC/UnbV domain-containing protein [Streptosporangiaceae bacterium]|nr:ASPIC/UnbV domain-containing protein [Streptosporangiaceae bacterium]